MSASEIKAHSVPSDEASRLLISVLRAELCADSKNLIEGISDTALSELLALAGRHDVAHLAADYLLRFPLSDDMKTRCKSLKASAQYRYVQQSRVLATLSDTLERGGIDHIPLKGAVQRELYPAPWMRTCSDIDILVHEEDIKRAVKLAETEMGMERVFHGSHDIKLRYRNKVTVELHYRLLEEGFVKGASRLMSECWRYTTGETRCKRMTDEMFYLYHIVHMAKHLEYGGCGIRFFLDLWLLDHKASYDEQKRNDLLKKADLLKFAQKARLISEKWFSGVQAEGTEHIERFIIMSGSFGSMAKGVSVRKYKKGGTLGYLRSRLFVPYDYMRIIYPSVEGRRYLMPLYEAVRWFRFVLPESRSHTAAELSKLMKDSGSDAVLVLKDMDLL